MRWYCVTFQIIESNCDAKAVNEVLDSFTYSWFVSCVCVYKLYNHDVNLGLWSSGSVWPVLPRLWTDMTHPWRSFCGKSPASAGTRPCGSRASCQRPAAARPPVPPGAPWWSAPNDTIPIQTTLYLKTGFPYHPCTPVSHEGSLGTGFTCFLLFRNVTKERWTVPAAAARASSAAIFPSKRSPESEAGECADLRSH